VGRGRARRPVDGIVRGAPPQAQSAGQRRRTGELDEEAGRKVGAPVRGALLQDRRRGRSRTEVEALSRGGGQPPAAAVPRQHMGHLLGHRVGDPGHPLRLRGERQLRGKALGLLPVVALRDPDRQRRPAFDAPAGERAERPLRRRSGGRGGREGGGRGADHHGLDDRRIAGTFHHLQLDLPPVRPRDLQLAARTQTAREPAPQEDSAVVADAFNHHRRWAAGHQAAAAAPDQRGASALLAAAEHRLLPGAGAAQPGPDAGEETLHRLVRPRLLDRRDQGPGERAVAPAAIALLLPGGLVLPAGREDQRARRRGRGSAGPRVPDVVQVGRQLPAPAGDRQPPASSAAVAAVENDGEPRLAAEQAGEQRAQLLGAQVGLAGVRVGRHQAPLAPVRLAGQRVVDPRAVAGVVEEHLVPFPDAGQQMLDEAGAERLARGVTVKEKPDLLGSEAERLLKEDRQEPGVAGAPREVVPARRLRTRRAAGRDIGVDAHQQGAAAGSGVIHSFTSRLSTPRIPDL
jgi:hypothetical protein